MSDMARDIKVNMKHKLKAENLISAFCLYFLVGGKGEVRLREIAFGDF